MESACRCLAYCLMDNHYHLVLRSDELRLSDGMQSLNSRYAEHFNLAYGLTGHLFQGRFQAKLIESDSYLFEVIRYVLLNPVSAGLCVQPDLWSWSSYSVMTGERAHRDWFDRDGALLLFAEDDVLAVRRFVEFVACGEPSRKLLTPAQHARLERDREIQRTYLAGGHTIRSLAEAFGVSPATVVRAVSVSKGV